MDMEDGGGLNGTDARGSAVHARLLLPFEVPSRLSRARPDRPGTSNVGGPPEKLERWGQFRVASAPCKRGELDQPRFRPTTGHLDGFTPYQAFELPRMPPNSCKTPPFPNFVAAVPNLAFRLPSAAARSLPPHTAMPEADAKGRPPHVSAAGHVVPPPPAARAPPGPPSQCVSAQCLERASRLPSMARPPRRQDIAATLKPRRQAGAVRHRWQGVCAPSVQPIFATHRLLGVRGAAPMLAHRHPQSSLAGPLPLCADANRRPQPQPPARTTPPSTPRKR